MRAITTPACFAFTTGLCTGLVLLSGNAFAQVIPDGTLPTSVTSPNNLNFAIDGGSRSGNNLFHSFGQFSVPTGGSAVFNNATDIQNIFSRVTGGTISSIDGLIQANGSANLFLLNPNGILFGPNAALNIGGSFIGTTANSIKFADGVEFSAVNANGSPLLTISVPMGLQFGQNPGAIVNRAQPPGDYLGYSPIGLQTQPGQTLALIGGDVLIEGSGLTAPDGHIELSGVGSDSLVKIEPDSLGWKFSYDQVREFADIALTQASVLNASGFGSGSITVQGRNISLADGSSVSVDTSGELPGGDVLFQASDLLQLTDAYIYPTSLEGATGRGSNVTIAAQTLRLLDGSQIGANTLGAGDAGNLTVRTTDLELLGRSGGGVIANASLIGSTGNGGTLTITTQRLKMQDGSLIAVSTVGVGNSGNLNIVASESVQVSGTNRSGRRPTSLLAGVGLQGQSFGATGKAGNLMITTEHLSVTEGGQVSAATYENSDAGNLIVKANLVDVSGRSVKTGDPSRVTSTSIKNFAAGSVTLQANQLRVQDGAEVSVSALGTGQSGSMSIIANSIQLDTAGKLRAEANAGDQGNITIDTTLLQMRRGSSITTNAGGTANGGNITISAPIILGLENSDIVANAIKGQGGNITITTQGMVGLAFRNTLTPRTDPTNDITASSEFSINGTVQINNIGVDPNAGLVNLPANLTDPTQKIAQGCAANRGSSFVITGRGGTPTPPMTQLIIQRPWADLRPPTTDHSAGAPTSPALSPSPSLVEATGWRRNAAGQLELFAATPTTPALPNLAVMCAGVMRSKTVNAVP